MYTGRRCSINVFVTFGIFAILLVTITYLFIFRVMSDERAAQDRLFFKISSSNNILVDIENCRSAITQYRHAWESKYLELYLSSIEKINSDVRIYLSETDSFSYENIQSVRRLSNFLAYQSRFDLIWRLSPRLLTSASTTSAVITGLSRRAIQTKAKTHDKKTSFPATGKEVFHYQSLSSFLLTAPSLIRRTRDKSRKMARWTTTIEAPTGVPSP